MASMTISNPGVGRLFDSIGSILAGPNPQALMQADYLKTQRDNVMSDTAINTQKLATLKREEGAMSSLATLLGDPTLASTPEGRASLMSILSQVPDGLKSGPGFATGAASFVDPNFVQSEGDFSRILAGTGVQPDWGKTPTGYAAGLDNNLDVQTLRNAGDLAVAGVKANTPGAGLKPLTISPAMSQKFADMMTETLTGRYGAGGVGAMDPQFMDDLTARAAEIFQTNRNADAAIRQAMDEAKLRVEDQNGWWPGGEAVVGDPIQLALGATDTSGLGDVLAPPVAAPNTAPPQAAPVAPPPTPDVPGAGLSAPMLPPQQAAPAAAPAPQRDAAPQEGATPSLHTNADGTVFYVGPGGQPITVTEGHKVRDRRTGQILEWRGGKWVPLSAQTNAAPPQGPGGNGGW